MSTDAASPEGASPSRFPPTRWTLPDLLSVHAKRVRYRKPKPYAKGPRLAEADEAIEILVETSGPFPTGAYGPVIYVDDVPLTESERLGEHIYRFFGYEPASLKPGAAISLGWVGRPEEETKRTKFRFNVEGEITRDGGEKDDPASR